MHRRGIEVNGVYQADLLDLCDRLDNSSVDMILCDLPYGTTNCEWDAVIPFEPMWKAFQRVIKKNGAIVLTASPPFTGALMMSNPRDFKYQWYWFKKYHSNPFLSKVQPLRVMEDVLVFSSGSAPYYPQMLARPQAWMRETASRSHNNDTLFKNAKGGHSNRADQPWMYPTNLIEIPQTHPARREKLHPTQKPVALFRYLIRTYTQPGELVLDPCCGSGTSGYAAREEGRQFIIGDLAAEYVAIARQRLAAPSTLPMLDS